MALCFTLSSNSLNSNTFFNNSDCKIHKFSDYKAGDLDFNVNYKHLETFCNYFALEHNFDSTKNYFLIINL